MKEHGKSPGSGHPAGRSPGGSVPELSSERLQRLATGLIAGFVHDLNSSFASIELFLDLVQDSLEEADREMAKKVRHTLDELAAREEHLHWIGRGLGDGRRRPVELGVLVDAVIRLWQREHPECDVVWVNQGTKLAVPGWPLVLLSALDRLVAACLAPPPAESVDVEIGEEPGDAESSPARASILLRRALVGDEAHRPSVPMRASDLEPIREAVEAHGGRLEVKRDERGLEAKIVLPR